MSTSRTVPITTNYAITVNDAINTSLQVTANSQPIVLTLPNTDGIADCTWTIQVTDATHIITLADSQNEATIYLGGDTPFQATANLATTGTFRLRFDGTHFVFDA